MKKTKRLMIIGLSAATAAVAATGAVSSFAWFATNNTVSATGMKIKASANEVYLQINTSNNWDDVNDAYRTKAASVGEATLSAVHPVKAWDADKTSAKVDTTDGMTSYKGDGTETAIPNWVSATSASADSADKDDNPYTNKTTEANTATTSTSNNGYTLLNQFYLRLRPAESGTQPSVDNLTASVKWATTPTYASDAIAASVRVLLWNDTDDRGAIYTPATSGDGDSTVFTEAWTVNGADLLGADTVKMEGATENPYNARLISVYVYFDGEDARCKSNNIKVNNSYSVNVDFSVSKN